MDATATAGQRTGPVLPVYSVSHRFDLPFQWTGGAAGGGNIFSSLSVLCIHNQEQEAFCTVFFFCFIYINFGTGTRRHNAVVSKIAHEPGRFFDSLTGLLDLELDTCCLSA